MGFEEIWNILVFMNFIIELKISNKTKYVQWSREWEIINGFFCLLYNTHFSGNRLTQFLLIGHERKTTH